MNGLSDSHLPFLYLRHPDDTWIVGSGGFERQAVAPKNHPAFYLPDFFLDDENPWWVPEHVARLNQAELKNQWPTLFNNHLEDKKQFEWHPPDFHSFEREFSLLHSFASQSSDRKAVGLTASVAEGTPSEKDFYRWWRQSLQKPARWLAYGARFKDEGMVGLSPEILFLLEDNHLECMALAGTAPAESPESLLDSRKDRHEHQIVVDDITRQLSQLGAVFQTPTYEWNLGRLKHLRTNLSVKSKTKFENLVKLLHPTPALGVSPRDPELRLLRESEHAKSRGRFGAPFGISWPGELNYAIVAIRGIEWGGGQTHLRTGCGIVAASELEKEWAELQLKAKVIREQFEI